MIMIIAATNANAQSCTKRTDKSKIKQGVRSGELTRKEATSLVNQQKDIRQDMRTAKADGIITNAEEHNIKSQKRQADRNIYRKKNNDRDRG